LEDVPLIVHNGREDRATVRVLDGVKSARKRCLRSVERRGHWHARIVGKPGQGVRNVDILAVDDPDVAVARTNGRGRRAAFSLLLHVSGSPELPKAPK
jgi:hypothetical protein